MVISHLFDQKSKPLEVLTKQAQVWSLRRVPEVAWVAKLPGRRIVHWGLGPVLSDFTHELVRQGLSRYLAEYPVELFSFDLGPSALKHCGLLPLSRPLSPSAIRRRTEAGIKFIRQFYLGPLAAENYNFYPTGLYNYITEPDFIHKFLAEFNLGLVLDLAHGAVSAHNLGIEAEDYFNSLPLERVAELHISRPWIPTVPKLWAVDKHGPPGVREWQWLKNLLATGRLPSNVPIFIECYSSPRQLSKSQDILASLLGA